MHEKFSGAWCQALLRLTMGPNVVISSRLPPAHREVH